MWDSHEEDATGSKIQVNFLPVKKRAMFTAQTPMPRRLIGSALLVLAGLFGCADSGPQYPLRLVGGSVTSPEQWHGQWVLINYWADWCGPCREEVPELNHLSQAEGGFKVLGVNYDYLKGSELQEAIDNLGIEFPTLIDDPQRLLGYDEATVLPMSVLISPDGALHRILIGPQNAESLHSAKAGSAAPVGGL